MHLGAIAPGYQADILFLRDLESFVPERVLKRGRPVGDDPDRVRARVGPSGRFTSAASTAADFAIPWSGGKARVIGLVPDQIITDVARRRADGRRTACAVADPDRDLAKIAVLERHLETGRIGLGFVRGFGLQRGAFGATVAHDAHNLIVVGVDDDAMATHGRAAARARRRASSSRGQTRCVAELPLPVAGLLSDRPLAEVLAASREVVAAASSRSASPSRIRSRCSPSSRSR